MGKKLDWERDYGLRYGSNDGSAYEQDGVLFNAKGEEINPPPPVEKEIVAPEAMSVSDLKSYLLSLDIVPKKPITAKSMLDQLKEAGLVCR